MQVVITGGAGFIGSNLCDYLLSLGEHLVCIDNFLTGSPSNVQHLQTNPAFFLTNHDITQPISVEGPVDYVVSLAIPASPVDYLRFPLETLRAGSLGTMNALELARAKGAPFLLTSTSEVYGDPLESPQREEYWGNVNPVGPRSVYDEAKRFSEALTMAYHRLHHMDTKIARIFNTYGPRMRAEDGRAIPTFMLQALRGQEMSIFGDGSQTRSFCYISDMVQGLHKLMLSSINQPVNLGNPQEVTISRLAEMVQALVGGPSKVAYRPLPQDDPRRRCPDISLARGALGWEPKVSLEEGLEKTLKWFRKKHGLTG